MKFPLGFRYSATYAGIRKDSREDLGLIVSDQPASAAAVFTTNRVQAAPVRIARQHLRASRGRVSAIIVNAGNANCATKNGDEVALSCCRAVAKQLKVPVAQILPASTGVIGVEMDPNLVVAALPRLFEDLLESRFPDVAHAMMTTDTVPKMAHAEVSLKGGDVQIAGMTKGSGMIHPNMATTLGFVMTDAAISPIHLRQMLVNTVERSFNRLCVDGDMSTNDIVVLLANGASGIRPSERERRSMEESLVPGDGGSGRADRARRRRRHEADHDSRGRRGGRGIGGEDRPLHRKFAAGEDCHRGIGPELGTGPVGGRDCPVSSSIPTRSTSTCRACRFARTALRPTSPRRI